MNTLELKKIVLDAYAVDKDAQAVPPLSTQFKFTEKEVLVRIPIYECQPPPPPLVALICRVINAALPHLKIKIEDLRQDLLAAAEGKQIGGPEIDIRGISASTSIDGGKTVHAVTECRVLIRGA